MSDKAGIQARIGYCLLCLVIALVLAGWFVVPADGSGFGNDSLVGPATWPRAMLVGIACCSVLLLLRNALQYAQARHHRAAPAQNTDGEFDNRKAVLGGAFLILYVALMPLIGFAISTLAFFLFWLPYGGVRKPFPVVSVALVGTVALLFTFVKLTTLPLERGIGAFDGITVSLYRLLGIY